MAGNHFRDGRPWMVDVAEKSVTTREAIAEAVVLLPPEAKQAVTTQTKKGDPLRICELAGIMAAKRTSELIPLCHPIPLDACEVKADPCEEGVRITSRCLTSAKTGVEMEAMTAASVAALTLYDMLKGISKGIVIREVRLLRKEGGKSGTWSA